MQHGDSGDDMSDANGRRANGGADEARLLLVVDHDVLRRQIVRLLLDRVGALEISEAIDCREALTLALWRAFPIIIIDLDLAHEDAIGLAVDLQRLRPGAKLILLSRLGDEALTPADLPLAQAVIVPRQLIGAVLPAAVVQALARRPLP